MHFSPSRLTLPTYKVTSIFLAFTQSVTWRYVWSALGVSSLVPRPLPLLWGRGLGMKPWSKIDVYSVCFVLHACMRRQHKYVKWLCEFSGIDLRGHHYLKPHKYQSLKSLQEYVTSIFTDHEILWQTIELNILGSDGSMSNFTNAVCFAAVACCVVCLSGVSWPLWRADKKICPAGSDNSHLMCMAKVSLVVTLLSCDKVWLSCDSHVMESGCHVTVMWWSLVVTWCSDGLYYMYDLSLWPLFSCGHVTCGSV